MDIVSLLRKTGQTVDDFDIKVLGEISKQAPIEYIAIHLIYNFKGSDEARDAAIQAVYDSQEKYCGVSSMLKKALPVTWEVNFNDIQVFSNKNEELSLSLPELNL